MYAKGQGQSLNHTSGGVVGRMGALVRACLDGEDGCAGHRAHADLNELVRHICHPGQAQILSKIPFVGFRGIFLPPPFSCGIVVGTYVTQQKCRLHSTSWTAWFLTVQKVPIEAP